MTWVGPSVTSKMFRLFPLLCWFVHCIVLIQGQEPEFLYEPSSRLVKPSDGKVVFRCDVSPPSADVRWLWNGQPVLPSRWIKVSRHKLTVQLGKVDKTSKSPFSSENGYFQCEARSKGKVLVSTPAELIIAVLEQFETQDDVHVNVIKGNTAVIPCKLPYSVPTVVTEYQFNNTIISKSTNKHLLMHSGNLQILDADFNDSGEYVCIAYNPYLGEKVHVNHKVYLHVSESMKIELPRFIVAPQPVTSISLGSNVTLECVASGYPIPFVTWRKHHGNLPKSRYQQIGGNLLLIEVNRADEGEYICHVENSLGSRILRSSVIEVQETPEVIKSPRDTLLTVGQNLSLECFISGHPKPNITWMQNGRNLTNEDGEIEGSQIKIWNVSVKHSGIYQCFAYNILGSVYAKSTVLVSTNNKSLHMDYGNQDYNDYDSDGSPKYNHWKSHAPAYPHQSNYNGRHHNANSGHNVHSDHFGKRHHKKKNKGVRLIPPSRPEVTRLSDTSVMVRWSVPRNDGLPISFFKVQYREVGKRNSHWMTIEDDIAAHIHSYAVTDLRNGGKYRFRIAAVYSNNDNKLGPNSSKFVLYKDPPTKKPIKGPIITHAEAASPSAITLHWEYTDLDSIPIEGFFIYYRTTHSAGDYLKVTVLGANTRSHIISHLLPETAYDIKTQCFNIAGTSEFSNIYTSKTKPSENLGVHGRSSKYNDDDDENMSNISVTEPVSSKDSKGNLMLDIVLGVISAAMLIAITVFVGLYIRQRTNRPPNSSEQQNRAAHAKPGNGHIGNGYLPVNGVNISVNPLSDLDDHIDDDKSDQEDAVSNNNKEEIQLETFRTNENPQLEPLLVQKTNETSVDGCRVEQHSPKLTGDANSDQEETNAEITDCE